MKPVMKAIVALLVIAAATLPCVLTFADVQMKALLAPCDNKAYEPKEVHNGVTKCKNKIQVTLLVNSTPGGNIGKGYVHLTEVYEPELERTSRLFNTIVIRLRQEELLLAYPMKYMANVNGKVTEKVVVHDSCDLTVCAGYVEQKMAPKGYCCGCDDDQNCTIHCLQYSPVWYTMSLLGPPIIKQEMYVELFVQRDRARLPERWRTFSEYPEELMLSADHPEDVNSEKTVSASFLSEKAAESAFVLKDYRKLRVLVPFPPVGIPVENFASIYTKGSDSIMLIPSNLTKPADVMECINKSLANATKHCHPQHHEKCLEGEPYDIFLDEEQKLASSEDPSPLLLSYFKDKLPESPILFNETSGERFLSFIYEHPHLSLILLEINADDIVLLRQGTKGRINVVSAHSSDSGSLVRIEVTNLGELATIFSAQVTQCSHGVANSDTDAGLVTPQRTLLLLTSVHFGALDIRDDLKCMVELHDSEYGMIASRSVILRPGKQCICYLSCECSCGNESLSCHLITELDALKAGLYKSRTTRSSDRKTSRDRVVQFIMYCFLTTLGAGFLKGCLGVIGCGRVGQYGLHSCVYGRGHLKQYYEPELSKYTVQHDNEGYPIHPKTKLRTRVISYCTEFFLNVAFFFIWPVLLYSRTDSRGTPPKYELLDSNSSSLEDDSDRITHPISEVIIPVQLSNGRRTRSKTWESAATS
ncbi:hapless 2 isoform X1 [Rhipicephalus microplus]|uniref:hapless 2 isoform X1 n=2 Tax=Rhipicephalus microplus TaxID=6941 RepID=UPI003F6C8F91